MTSMHILKANIEPTTNIMHHTLALGILTLH
jgi:hypothetical protein